MNIFFSGIGGVGIGPLAEIAADMGHRVAGSDLSPSLVTDELERRGIDVNIGQDGSYLRACHQAQPIEWFVYTAALPDDHPELLLARELGIHIAKRDELLSAILREKNLKLLAVAGTHGKTSTTGMWVWTLQQLGVPVSYSIGATIPFGPSGHYEPDSEFFVYECDEFDRNFLHFSPYVSLITSIDHDHVDTFPSHQEYGDAFCQFIDQSTHAILWQSAAHRIGLSVDESCWALDEDKEVADVALAGVYTRQNATLVLKAIEYLGLDSAQAAMALASFPGTSRRFEKLADNLYSDYAHHPVEVAATLSMAREVSDDVVVVYQPHQNRRQHEVRELYRNQFEGASQIYWLPTYLSRENPRLEILTPDILSANLTNRDKVALADLDDTLWHSIQTARERGALVVCMGAGTIDDWVRRKLDQSS